MTPLRRRSRSTRPGSRLALLALVLLLPVAASSHPVFAQERMVFMSQKDTADDSASRRYLVDLEHELHAIAGRLPEVHVWDSAPPVGGMQFFADQGLGHVIQARLSAHSAGARVNLVLRETGTGLRELFEYSVLLDGVSLADDVAKLDGRLRIWFWPTVLVRSTSGSRRVLLAHCIWPLSDTQADLSSFLTLNYPQHLAKKLPSAEFSVQGHRRLDLGQVCEKGQPYPLASAYDVVIFGHLAEDGSHVELYYQPPSNAPMVSVQLPIPADPNVQVEELARQVASLDPLQ